MWSLYELTVTLCGPVSTLIEWDDEIPEFPRLLAEAERARQIRERALSTRVDDPALGVRLEEVRRLARAPEGVCARTDPGLAPGRAARDELSAP